MMPRQFTLWGDGIWCRPLPDEGCLWLHSMGQQVVDQGAYPPVWALSPPVVEVQAGVGHPPGLQHGHQGAGGEMGVATGSIILPMPSPATAASIMASVSLTMRGRAHLRGRRCCRRGQPAALTGGWRW